MQNTTTRSVELGNYESIGLAFAAQAGVLSFVGSVAALGRLLYYLWRRHVLLYQDGKYSPEKSVAVKPLAVDLFPLNFFISNTIQAIGQSLDIVWVVTKRVQSGDLCTTQGILQQIGQVATAFGIVLVALHLFWVNIGWPRPWYSLEWQRRYPVTARQAIASICMAWIVTLCLSLTFPFLESDYFAPNPYWCWIRRPFMLQLWLTSEVWLIAALVLSIALYSAVIASTRKIFSLSKASFYLAYPMIYIVFSSLSTISHWYYLANNEIPAALKFTAAYLSGIIGFLSSIYFFWGCQQDLRLANVKDSITPEVTFPWDRSLENISTMSHFSYTAEADHHLSTTPVSSGGSLASRDRIAECAATNLNMKLVEQRISV